MGVGQDMRGDNLARARGLLAKTTLGQKVSGGAVLALLATAPFGGLSATPQPNQPEIVLGTPFHIGPYEVTVAKVVEVADLKPALTPKPGQRLLVLDATVQNTSTRPDYVPLLARNLGVSGSAAATDTPPTVIAVADSTNVSIFNPGVTQRVAIAYTLPGPWGRDTVTVRATALKFVAEDPLGLDDQAWRPADGPQRTGSLPVTVRP